jgi:hypothetical protein
MAYHAFANGVGRLTMGATTPNQANGSVAEVEPELTTLYHRYEQFQEYDLEKNKFINVRHIHAPSTTTERCITDNFQELLTRIEFLTQQYETLSAERMRNHEFISTWQAEKQEYVKLVQGYERVFVRPPPDASCSRRQNF